MADHRPVPLPPEKVADHGCLRNWSSALSWSHSPSSNPTTATAGLRAIAKQEGLHGQPQTGSEDLAGSRPESDPHSNTEEPDRLL